MNAEEFPDNAVATLLPRAEEIAAIVMAKCAAEIPAYQRLPASVLEGDLVTNAKALLELFLKAVGEGRPLTEQELALPVSWGAERARDGLPLEAVLRIYPISVREMWRYAVAEALPDRLEILRVVDHILDFLATVLPLVTEAYLREQRDLTWEKREGQQSLATALLDGRPTERLTERVGTTLAADYAVVVYRLPDVSANRSNREATKLIRAIQAALDDDVDILRTFERDRGVLLVPSPAPGAAGEQWLRTHVPAVLAAVDAAAHTGNLAAAAIATGNADIPRAHQEAGDVLALAERLSRGAGVFWLSDLAIEYQLAQPGPARDYLARLLDPVTERPHLLDALRAFVAAGYNRGEAASALNIHRNTLNYRLGRIHTMSGYDPTQPQHARTLAASLVAHDIATAEAN